MSFKFTWILVNKLSIGNAPQKIEDINYLTKMGIKSILSLNSIEETIFHEALKNKFKFERYVLPDHKYKRIANLNEINEVVDILYSLMRQSPVFVHCVASIERSPLIAMAWLIKNNNLSPQEALSYVMQIHPGTSPQTTQLKVLEKIYSSQQNI